jgi:hypothetical protein
VQGFATVPDSPRLLHRRSQYGYVSDPERAMFGEPEAVPAEVQEQYSIAAERRARELQLRDWREHRAEIERRFEWVYAQRFQRNVRAQLRTLQYQFDRLDQRITGKA